MDLERKRFLTRLRVQKYRRRQAEKRALEGVTEEVKSVTEPESQPMSKELWAWLCSDIQDDRPFLGK
jgi:hypothetical protein